MADLPEGFMPHRVDVKPLVGQGPYGEEYGPVFTLPCFARFTKRLLGTGSTGESKVTYAVLRAPARFAEQVTEESEVLLHGKWRTITSVSVNDDGGFGAWQHLKVEVE